MSDTIRSLLSSPFVSETVIRYIFSGNRKEVTMERKRCILMLQSKLLKIVEIVQQRLNPALQITGLIGMHYDQRKNLNKEVVTILKEYFGETLLTTLSTSACRHCHKRSRERGGSSTSNRGVSLCLSEKGGVMSHQLEDLYTQRLYRSVSA